jgi:hypothetical protein
MYHIGDLKVKCTRLPIGKDTTAFGKASHPVGWIGLRLCNDESAGKILSRKTLHGNNHLRQMLVEMSGEAAGLNHIFM